MSNLKFLLVTLARSSLGLGLGLLVVLKLSAQSLLPVDAGTTVNGLQNNFSGSALGANWVLHVGTVYSVSGGLLHVTQAEGNPNHLLYEFPGYDSTLQEMLAHFRVLDFAPGDQRRGGLAPDTCQGPIIFFGLLAPIITDRTLTLRSWPRVWHR